MSKKQQKLDVVKYTYEEQFLRNLFHLLDDPRCDFHKLKHQLRKEIGVAPDDHESDTARAIAKVMDGFRLYFHLIDAFFGPGRPPCAANWVG